MISVFDVAKYFLAKSVPNSERAITHLKLQKLVYYAQAWHLALRDGKPLFHEKIEAWIHGPVCPELYNEYRSYGYSEIPPVFQEPSIPKKQREVLDDVWEAYGSFSGGYLEQLTHKEEPWIRARAGLKEFEYSNNIISIQRMESYYKKFVGAKR
ncbi:Panacea domain-containing protein [Brevibacillus sp. HD1.4A]|uniref:Panacea domain-containing protein n=1 Tax=Brevibacillus sp. HD1.4A TaxID=2738978 RepID=UPI00156B5DA4|nr:type II toxin-antitoxin system antitoxin SocA domain-containing protein [Brevibacillus sp. HD1.4A]NRQ54500.1 SocA family protein [Brevibacillus sp. HD1.4A]